jgi:hypothetical protein
MGLDYKDMVLRFLFGGGAVALSYILSALIPLKTFGGIFAAFPAVMAAAVIVTGVKEGSGVASDIAYGAISGMLGCLSCVLAALIFMHIFSSWTIGILLGLVVWFFASAFFFKSIASLLKRIRSNVQQSNRNADRANRAG